MKTPTLRVQAEVTVQGWAALSAHAKAMLGAVAALRDAYYAADDWEKRLVVQSLKTLFSAPSIQGERPRAVKVLRWVSELTVDLKPRNALLDAVFPSKWKPGGP